MVARQKLEFLEHQIDWHAPWIVAVMEVGGGLDRMRALRGWFRRRGLREMVFLMGEGSSTPSRDKTDNGTLMTNGIVVACHRDVSILSSKRLAFRTFAVMALHKPSRTRLPIVVVHGASTEGASADEECDAAPPHAAFHGNWMRQRNGASLATG